MKEISSFAMSQLIAMHSQTIFCNFSENDELTLGSAIKGRFHRRIKSGIKSYTGLDKQRGKLEDFF